MTARATEKQVWLIKKLAREVGYPPGEEIQALGLVGGQEWASLRVYEASRLINVLKKKVAVG